MNKPEAGVKEMEQINRYELGFNSCRKDALAANEKSMPAAEVLFSIPRYDHHCPGVRL